MSNLLTRKEFASLINKQPNYVGIYISRKKIIEVNKRIDTNNEVNRAFIAKHVGVKDDKPVIITDETKSQQTSNNNTESNSDNNGKISQGNIDYIIRQHDLKLKAVRIAKEKLDLERKKAKVLPIDFVGDMLNLYVKVNLSSIKTNGHKLIGSIVDQFGGDNASKLLLIKQFDQTVSDTFKHNHEIISKDCQDMAKKYALDRNW